MLEIGICDDDRLLLGDMEDCLKALGVEKNVELKIEIFEDGEDIVRAVSKGKRFDIIYMDIEMKNMDGLTASRKIRELDRAVQLVYVTSYDRYMKESFQAAPIGFIVKPIENKEFVETFDYILKLIEKEDLYYRFRYDRSDYKVLLKDVIYFESKRRMTEIEWKGGRFKLYKNLESVEEELKVRKTRFVRIHKSYLVNYWYIARCANDIVELVDGTRLPVSRSRRKDMEWNLFETMEWYHLCDMR